MTKVTKQWILKKISKMNSTELEDYKKVVSLSAVSTAEAQELYSSIDYRLNELNSRNFDVVHSEVKADEV